MFDTLESIALNFKWLSYVFLTATSICFCFAAHSSSKALWLWRHRNTPVSDSIIAEALKNVQPPKFWLFSLLWAILGTFLFVFALFLLNTTVQ
ncbi:hypothetical protein [Alcaligenes faecalis]|uniref:hypothetical protein n=1 Tax=Alcaligenes faecalis TaxID=511 RepID=UPI0024BC0AB5|nr:hypothetical protein [Alcaligenes faecalis]WHQ45924.1 hypothetical protein E8D21_19950 [Alcaligenes faecalis]